MTEQEVKELLKNNLNRDFVSDFFAKEKLDEEFLEKYVGYFDESYQFEKIVLEEIPEEWWIEFVENKLNTKHLWDLISMYQKLSEGFIERHFDKIDWDYISSIQKLSESFIERYFDKVNWSLISKHQNLSEGFIERHSNKVDWFWISQHQKLSEEFRKKHHKFIEME